MSTHRATAQVHDIDPARLHRLVAQPQTNTGIFADMTDGLLVAQDIFNLWGYEWDEAKFALLIIGLCGDSDAGVELYDEELAAHARTTDRTIRRWRAAHLARVRQLKSGPLIIAEGEYDADRKRYERTHYRVAPALGAAIARAVAEARGSADYQNNRHAALQRAAKENYYDLPDVPAPKRMRKPNRSQRAPVVRHVNNAKKALERGQAALAEMNDLKRAAVLAREGESLRATLEAMQAEIAQLLSALPANIDSEQVDDMQDKMSGIPPASESEHTPEDHAVFERVMARAAGTPAVRAVEVELRPPHPPPRELSYEREMTDEELESEAIRAEGCGVL